jgi:peptide deformylase
MENNLALVYAPNKIFKQTAKEVEKVDDSVRKIANDMLDLMYQEKAVGIGANMVGILQRIAVVDIVENNKKSPHIFINPKITWRSSEMQEFTEASLCFRGIDAKVTRPNAIKMDYQDLDGKDQKIEAEGFLATVIQHEVDYLDGKVFLDYLSKMKRDNLLTKMKKYIKYNPPHVHTSACNHI